MLMTYFGARFGVLGIYINGRYRKARDRHRRAAALADPQHGEAVVKKK
jgi:hypothetical protein